MKVRIVVSSLGSAYRREKLNGRDYAVAPVTLIVEGVLDGSNGPLLYTQEELSVYPAGWNGVPLVVDHPQRDGEYVSARHPEVLADCGIGWVFNVVADPTLHGEAWFDLLLTAAYDERLPEEHQMTPRIEAGLPIEVSTGLYSDDREAPKDAEFNGKRYTHVATNFKPDHLAVLPDKLGACSNEDGCGINVNGGSMNRKKTIAWLVANCDCWKDAGSAELLEKMTDKALAKLMSNAQRAAKFTVIVNRLKGNAEGEEGSTGEVDIAGLAEYFGVTADPASDPIAFVDELKSKMGAVMQKLGGTPAAAPAASEEEEEEETAVYEETEEEEKKKKEPVAASKHKKKKKLSMQEFLDTMPEEALGVWNTAVEVSNREKTGLVKKLLSNVKDPKRRKALGAKYMKMKASELKELVELMGNSDRQRPLNPSDAPNPFDTSFDDGGDDGDEETTVNEGDEGEDDDDLLDEPLVNFERMQARRKAE